MQGDRQKCPVRLEQQFSLIGLVTDLSVIPRRLIGDLHEWRNEFPTVPGERPVKLSAGEDTCVSQRGEKTPLSFTATMRYDLHFYT